MVSNLTAQLYLGDIAICPVTQGQGSACVQVTPISAPDIVALETIDLKDLLKINPYFGDITIFGDGFTYSSDQLIYSTLAADNILLYANIYNNILDSIIYDTSILYSSDTSLNTFASGDVKLLLHMNGSSGSTVFTDSSPNNISVSVSGGAQISTAQNKFGGSSAYFDGTGDYLSIATNALFALNTGDFTIELWAYPSSYPSSDIFSLIDTRSASAAAGLVIWIGDDKKWVCYTSASNNAIQRTISSTSNALLNRWTHLAAVRYSGIVAFYVDGRLQGTAGVGGSPDNLSPTATAPVRIATAADQPGVTRMYNGYIDELRFIKDVAVYWPNNFAVPTGAFLP